MYVCVCVCVCVCVVLLLLLLSLLLLFGLRPDASGSPAPWGHLPPVHTSLSRIPSLARAHMSAAHGHPCRAHTCRSRTHMSAAQNHACRAHTPMNFSVLRVFVTRRRRDAPLVKRPSSESSDASTIASRDAAAASGSVFRWPMCSVDPRWRTCKVSHPPQAPAAPPRGCAPSPRRRACPARSRPR